MEVIQYTQTGTKKKTLSKAEIAAAAADGNIIAKKELLKDDLTTASTVTAKVNAILKYLDAV